MLRKLDKKFSLSLCDANCHRLVWQLFIQFNNDVEMPNTSTNMQPSKKIRFTFPVEKNIAAITVATGIQDELTKIRGLGSLLEVSMLKCDLNIHHCHSLCCLSKNLSHAKHSFISSFFTESHELKKTKKFVQIFSRNVKLGLNT